MGQQKKITDDEIEKIIIQNPGITLSELGEKTCLNQTVVNTRLRKIVNVYEEKHRLYYYKWR